MKIVKVLSLLILAISTIAAIKNSKSADTAFYPGATDQILLTLTTPLINMDDSTSQILNTCLKMAFTDKYEYHERDLWAKIERVNSKPNEMYRRAFWADFFVNIREDVTDYKQNKQNCASALTAKLKTEADFNDVRTQMQIRNSVGDYNKKVSSLVTNRQKTFITSSVSTHRYSKIVDQHVFNRLNQRQHYLR